MTGSRTSARALDGIVPGIDLVRGERVPVHLRHQVAQFVVSIGEGRVGSATDDRFTELSVDPRLAHGRWDIQVGVEEDGIVRSHFATEALPEPLGLLLERSDHVRWEGVLDATVSHAALRIGPVSGTFDLDPGVFFMATLALGSEPLPLTHD